MIITYLKIEESKSLQDFLVSIFGEKYRDIAKDDMEGMFADDRFKHSFLICKIDNQIIGAISFCNELFTLNMWGISWVCVHPDYRDQGIGQKMVLYCLDELARKIDKPSTALLATVKGKQNLYIKCGFVGTAFDHEGGLLMTKSIVPVQNKCS